LEGKNVWNSWKMLENDRPRRKSPVKKSCLHHVLGIPDCCQAVQSYGSTKKSPSVRNQRPGRWSSNKSRSVFMALCAQIQRFQSCTVDCSKM
jgi:hypothetical protein